MAINGATVKYFLLMKAKFGIDFEHTAMLGRQHLLTEKGWEGYEQFEQEDGYSETLFKKFGATKVDSFDYSDYEGATCLHDLNLPIPNTYKNKYTLVYDGGTLEHIFNYPVAIKNTMEMVKIGGTLLILTPINNQNRHGLYQLSAELLTDLLSGNGFQVMDISVEMRTEDVYTSRRFRLQSGLYPEAMANYKSKGTMLFVCAKKLGETPDVLSLQQSRYISKWEGICEKEEKVEYYELDRELGLNMDEEKIYDKEKIRVVLWGAGYNCNKLLMDIMEQQKDKIEVVALVDSDTRKQGSNLFGNEIYAPAVLNIIKKFDIDGIVITPNDMYQEEIENTLIYKYDWPQSRIFSTRQLEYYLKEPIYREYQYKHTV